MNDQRDIITPTPQNSPQPEDRSIHHDDDAGDNDAGPPTPLPPQTVEQEWSFDIYRRKYDPGSPTEVNDDRVYEQYLDSIPGDGVPEEMEVTFI